ncbi:MAG: hypothetical protein RIA72_13100 [Sphingopyxis sp.]|uniref:hypothetical protein n=1 Tax=Sphingopyxis sp. TaxID=1908224 RepID=UPI0032EF17A4
MGIDWVIERLTLENLKEWQTLVSGLLAICAGGFVVYQTRAQAREEKRKRLAKFEATRTLLPLTLSELIRWTNEIIRILEALRTSSHSQHLTKAERQISTPPLPANLINQLRDLVEYNDEKVFRYYISSILRKIQVSRSRLETIDPDKEPNLIVTRSDIDNNLYDFLELGLWLESLFKFARSESNSCPEGPDWPRFGTQLSIHNVNGSENLVARIKQKMESMKSHGLERRTLIKRILSSFKRRWIPEDKR